MSTDNPDRAIKVFEACYNGILPTPDGTAAPGTYPDLNMRMLGETWGDERLSMREKRFIVLSLLIGSGADPSLFILHSRCALKNKEMTAEDILTLLNFGLFYTGVKSTSLPWQQFQAMLTSMAKEAS